jgi:hypothetical protein
LGLTPTRILIGKLRNLNILIDLPHPLLMDRNKEDFTNQLIRERKKNIVKVPTIRGIYHFSNYTPPRSKPPVTAPPSRRS